MFGGLFVSPFANEQQDSVDARGAAERVRDALRRNQRLPSKKDALVVPDADVAMAILPIETSVNLRALCIMTLPYARAGSFPT
jgi:hypothetical protein